MHRTSPLIFVETAQVAQITRPEASIPTLENAVTEAPLDLDKLPDGIVSGNTLIDYSAASERCRSGLSLALAFANRTTRAEMRQGDDEDDWFAAYKSNLARLGFNVSQGAFVKSAFKKRGLAVHQAIIPFLTAALGGAGVGPVIFALLQNLQKGDADKPWITLFDQETRMLNTREMHFAAVNSDNVESKMRHVAARLYFVDKETNVLFFRINDTSADFESVTTTLSIDNGLLSTIEPALRDRLGTSALDFIKKAEVKNTEVNG